MHSLRILTAVLIGVSGTSLPAAAGIKPDTLLAVDQSRTEIINGLVEKWKDHLASGKQEELRKVLMTLRADKLLAASLAQDQKQFAALLEKSDFLPAPTTKVASPVEKGEPNANAKSVGEDFRDTVYTPINPCRVFDTRLTSPLNAGAARSFDTVGALAGQGGNAGGCGIPTGATAIVTQLTNEFPPASGFLIGGAEGTAGGGLMVWAANSQVTVSATIPLNTTNGRLALLANNSSTNLIGDVLGYFARPNVTSPSNLTFELADAQTGSDVQVLRINSTSNAANPRTVSVVAGSSSNLGTTEIGATVAGGGSSEVTCYNPVTGLQTRACRNEVVNSYATVGGGVANLTSGFGGVIAGGTSNTAADTYTAVGGGLGNNADGAQSTIAGGQLNRTLAVNATVGGGRGNLASGIESTVSGGRENTANTSLATVGGGFSNLASGIYSTVPGGSDNTASGSYSVAMGRRAKTLGNGSFQFADSSPFDFSSNTDNAFRVRATGGVRFVTDIDGAGNVTWSCLATAGNSWSCASDRNLKHSLKKLDGKAVLAKLVAMPVYQWQPKGQNAHVKHYGPMAQDFMKSFGLGDDDKMIGMQDADGVALAAIKGLHEIVKGKNAKINALQRELVAIKQRLGLQ